MLTATQPRAPSHGEMPQQRSGKLSNGGGREERQLNLDPGVVSGPDAGVVRVPLDFGFDLVAALVAIVDCDCDLDAIVVGAVGGLVPTAMGGCGDAHAHDGVGAVCGDGRAHDGSSDGASWPYAGPLAFAHEGTLPWPCMQSFTAECECRGGRWF